ncbi:MAG: HD domain-containing protein [Proteobacteria bacterium]|nr:HD domain-containing protein [Pseudomonadota bacterium]MBU1964415.1 HD domain-containing protein [Pseudomonadota bacterium]
MIQSPLKNKSLRRTVIAALLALILLLPFWWWTGLWYQGKLLTEKRAQIGEFLAIQGRSLGTEINGRLAILKALKTLVDGRVDAGQEISAVEFAAYAAGLFSGESGVHSLSIAPDGITQFLFPAGSSESLAGHDLLRDPRPRIRTDIQRAVRSRRIVISGPYALRPKGLGLVARQAVYAKENLWGLISLVLDLPPILTQAGLDSPPSGLEIALLDRSGRIFFGKKAALEGDPISFQVDLPDGSWKLAALPAGGWSAAVERPLLQFRGLTLALAFLTALLIGLAAGYQTRVTMAVRQRTGSLQRSLTNHREEEENLNRTLVNLRRAMGATLTTLVTAVEVKDPCSAGHQKRVADLARAIATEMGLSEEEIDGIRMAALIHDIGKISLPAEILGKPGKLSESEFQLIKTHAQTGYDMLKDGEFPWPVSRIVWQHHERMDGSGYPLGLKGEEILQGARVLAVADVVEAMASPRAYRPLPGLEKALEEILSQRGILYDPAVVDACRSIFLEKDFRLIV